MRGTSPDRRAGLSIAIVRRCHGLTVQQLARRVGITVAQLRHIEHGDLDASATAVHALVSAMGMSMDELFGLDGDAADRGASRPSLMLGDGVRWELLGSSADRLIDFLEVAYPRGAASSEGGELMSHRGYEHISVLSGWLEITIGPDTYLLAPSDSVSFSSATPHRLRAAGLGETRFLAALVREPAGRRLALV